MLTLRCHCFNLVCSINVETVLTKFKKNNDNAVAHLSGPAFLTKYQLDLMYCLNASCAAQSLNFYVSFECCRQNTHQQQ